MAEKTYYYGKGPVYLRARGTNIWKEVGDVSALSLAIAVQNVEHRESYSGLNSLARRFPIQQSGTINMTWHDFKSSNLALALYGTASTVSGATVASEDLPDDLAVGDIVQLANSNVLIGSPSPTFAITDSAGTPATLVKDTDYTLDQGGGLITILDLGSYTQPFKAAYTYGDRERAAIFTAGQPDIELLFVGKNLAEGGQVEKVHLFKVAPDPLQELAFISTDTDVAGMQITAGLLIDDTKSAAGSLGQFGVIERNLSA